MHSFWLKCSLALHMGGGGLWTPDLSANKILATALITRASVSTLTKNRSENKKGCDFADHVPMM